jgi:hypothetical protein
MAPDCSRGPPLGLWVSSSALRHTVFLPKLHSRRSVDSHIVGLAPDAIWETGASALAARNPRKQCVTESVTSFFTEPADFAAALAKAGIHDLVITSCGRFRARLSWVALEALRLSAGEESLSRIAFVTVPDQMILFALPSGTRPAPLWGGIVTQADEIMTFGPGSRLHMRTGVDCRWATILVGTGDLARVGRALAGHAFAVPMGIRKCQAPRAAGRRLRGLHSAAVRAVEGGRAKFIDREAAHGLDQQIIEALVECLSRGSVAAEAASALRCQKIMVRFEALLEKRSIGDPRMAGIETALGVSPRVLRRCCLMHLGMSADSYLGLRAIPIAHVVRQDGTIGAPGAQDYAPADLGPRSWRRRGH